MGVNALRPDPLSLIEISPRTLYVGMLWLVVGGDGSVSGGQLSFE